MPPNTMVADPSLDRKERVEDKTLIPTPNVQQRAGQSSRTSMHPLLSRSPPSQSYASQPASSQSPPTPTSYTPVSPVSPRRNEEMFSENSALLNGPPPAYTPSPVSHITTSEPAERSYSTFPEHRLESGIPPAREPESMGAPAYEPTENTPLASIKKLTPTKKRWLKHMGIAVLVLVIFTMFTTATFRHDKEVGSLPIYSGIQSSANDNHRPTNYHHQIMEVANLIRDSLAMTTPETIGPSIHLLHTALQPDTRRML